MIKLPIIKLRHVATGTLAYIGFSYLAARRLACNEDVLLDKILAAGAVMFKGYIITLA